MVTFVLMSTFLALPLTAVFLPKLLFALQLDTRAGQIDVKSTPTASCVGTVGRRSESCRLDALPTLQLSPQPPLPCLQFGSWIRSFFATRTVRWPTAGLRCQAFDVMCCFATLGFAIFRGRRPQQHLKPPLSGSTRAEMSRMRPGAARNGVKQRAMRVLKQKRMYEAQRYVINRRTVGWV